MCLFQCCPPSRGSPLQCHRFGIEEVYLFNATSLTLKRCSPLQCQLFGIDEVQVTSLHKQLVHHGLIHSVSLLSTVHMVCSVQNSVITNISSYFKLTINNNRTLHLMCVFVHFANKLSNWVYLEIYKLYNTHLHICYNKKIQYFLTSHKDGLRYLFFEYSERVTENIEIVVYVESIYASPDLAHLVAPPYVLLCCTKDYGICKPKICQIFTVYIESSFLEI